MSENGHANGDTGPQNLDRLMKALPGLKRELRKKAVKASRSTIYGPKGERLEKANRPRAICVVCYKPSDYAMVVVRTWEPRSNICDACAKLLQEGYTAFVAIAGHCICKDPSIAHLAGKIVPIPDAYYKKLKAKFDANKPKKPKGEEGQPPAEPVG